MTCPYINTILVLNNKNKMPNGKWESMTPTIIRHIEHAESLHEKQRRMGNKEDGGKIDGIFNKKGEWIVDTAELHTEILSSISAMYKRHWVPTIMNSILWIETVEDEMLRADIDSSERVIEKRDTMIRNLDLMQSILIKHRDERVKAPDTLKELNKLSINTCLTIPEQYITATDEEMDTGPLSSEFETWCQERNDEIQLARIIITNDTMHIHEILQPPQLPPEKEEAMNADADFIREYITTKEETYQIFRDTANGKISGPSGVTRNHILNAPTFMIKVIMGILNDMIDGIFPPCTTRAIIVPKIKDHYRIRPITLLDTYFRAYNGRFTKRLLNLVAKHKLNHPDQCGSFTGGQSAEAIDEVFLVAEDAKTHGKEAWVTFLDCSEAFDSMNDQVTDITLKAIGLPERLIKWIRRAKATHTRIVTTAGGMSKIATEIKVRGGIQGQPSSPVEWGLLSCAIIKYCQLRGGKGYTVQGKRDPQQVAILIQKSYVDDAKTSDSTKEGSTATSQATITMEMILNIRTNGPKCYVIISPATRNRILDEIEKWKISSPNKPSHPTVHLFDGIQGVQLIRNDNTPNHSRDQPQHVTLHRGKPSPDYMTTLIREDVSVAWGYTADANNIITTITPGSPADIAKLNRHDKIQKGPKEEAEGLNLRITVNTPTWKIKQTKDHPTAYHNISSHEAEIMAASHDLFSIKAIAMDSKGILRETKFTTILAKETTEGFREDTAKYLGIDISMHRGVLPSQESLIDHLVAACQSASLISKSPRELKSLIATAFSNIDYKLQSIPPTKKTLDRLRAAIVSVAIKSTGLTHLPESTGRLSSLVFMPEEVGLGYGFTDPTSIVVNKAASGILRQASSTSPNEIQCLGLALDRISDYEGRITQNKEHSPEDGDLEQEQLYLRLRTLFEEKIDIHSNTNPSQSKTIAPIT